MATAADGGERPSGLEALHLLKSTEPPLYLTPSPELSKAARLASEYLFTSINPYAPKSPFDHLLTEGFDAEQIWQQIDLQAQPLLSSLRRQVRNFEKNPSEIEKQFNVGRDSAKEGNLREDGKNKRNDGVESESEDFDEDDDMDEEDFEEDDDEGEEDLEEDDDEGEEEEGEESGKDDEDMENVEGKNVNGVEDKFLKIKELEKYLVEDEAREYGTKKDKKKKNKRKRGEISDEDEEDEEDDEEDEEDEDDELGLMGLGDEDGSDLETARYDDFFTSNKRTSQKKNPKYDDDGESDDMDTDEPESDDDNQNEQSLHSNEKDLGKLRVKAEEMEKANMQGKTKEGLSTHEKELEKLRAEIEEMETANMEPKTWTMQGEVTAAKRPQNSALEVDLDFEHNVRPVPQTTEEGTASLEELIKKRIIEGQFDDVQKPPNLLTKAPREKKELDESKSKKGLAELYEEDYAQKTGLVSAALSFSDEQKKEASLLFKKICGKLDALSHFHFAPKPVIEDMSIQANVPALAMEEIAPLVVSDAAMLAPEEVFSGKGDIKEEKELTKTERKRRRAKKKRQFKAESVKRMAVKAQLNTLKKPEEVAGNGESHE